MERLTANHGGEMIQKCANVRDSEFARLLAAPPSGPDRISETPACITRRLSPCAKGHVQPAKPRAMGRAIRPWGWA